MKRPEFLPGVTGYVPAKKLGRLANGSERGRGTRVHALIAAYSEGITYGTAVCGASVTRRCAGWICVSAMAPIDCPKCTQRLRGAFKRSRQ